MGLEPVEEVVGIDGRFQWEFPPPSGTGPDPGSGSRSGSAALSVWYFALPLTSAHRGGHSGGGALVDGVDGQERYRNEGTVYPHSGLVEMITYQEQYLPNSLGNTST